MPKLISMKRKADKSEGPELAKNTEDRYPYGLRIQLDKEDIDKLNIEMPDIGEEKMILCKVKVTDLSQHESEDDKYKSIGMQITDMVFEAKDNSEETVKALYG